MMKISVTTPSLNQAAYLADTIESVLSQEGDFEIEYFVMDGGSTDGSIEVIQSYAERIKNHNYPIRCRGVTFDWISKRDKGQSDAINQGLRRSSGDVAAYINSDDRYIPGAFAIVASAFDAHPNASFIYGDGNVIDEKGNVQWVWLSRPYSYRVLSSYHFLWNEFTNYLLQQAVFWRLDVLPKIGYFDESLHFSMDLEYWIRAGAAQLSLQHIPQKIAEFRLIQGTKSLSDPLAFWGDNLEIFRRYRSDSLAKFFAYYFYNFALHRDFNLRQLEADGPAILKRWKDTPDYARIERDAERGMVRAFGLIALELQRRGRLAEADDAYRRATRKSLIAAAPAAALFHLKRAVGNKGASAMNLVSHRLIQTYKRRRFDYRYYQ